MAHLFGSLAGCEWFVTLLLAANNVRQTPGLQGDAALVGDVARPAVGAFWMGRFGSHPLCKGGQEGSLARIGDDDWTRCVTRLKVFQPEPAIVADTYNQCVDQERAECCHKITSQ